MIGIVYATAAEADPFLTVADARKTADSPFPCFSAPAIPALILVSGMGKVAAALAAQALILVYRVERIVGAGICGALTDPPAAVPGRVYRIVHISEGEPGPGIPGDPPPLADDLFSDLPGADLVTRERPVFDPELRRRLASFGDLVDMEGAAVARVAALYGRPCSMIKGVTDFAGAGERAVLHENLAAVSRGVADCLWNEIGPSGKGTPAPGKETD